MATDIDPVAMELALQGAELNLPIAARNRFSTQVMDFRNLATVEAVGRADVLLVSGQLYEAELLQPLLVAIRPLCGHGCSMLVVCGPWSGGAGAGQRILEFDEALALIGFALVEQFPCDRKGYSYPGAGIMCVFYTR